MVSVIDVLGGWLGSAPAAGCEVWPVIPVANFKAPEPSELIAEPNEKLSSYISASFSGFTQL